MGLKISNDLENLINDLINTKINNKIIDSSGNNYIKLTDGTLICFVSTGSNSINANGSTDINVTLPQSYKDTNYIVLVNRRGGGSYWSYIEYTSYPYSTNTIRIGCWNNVGNASSLSFNVITIGRWK